MSLQVVLHQMQSWPSFRESRVLVVDDNPHNCQLLAGLLELLDVGHIDIAHDGLAGLEAVRQCPPDLILLDVMMPRMNGLEMCRALRQEFPRSRLPVVFVTGQGGADERTACFAAGGTDMVSKPINSAEILARVGVHLENHHLVTALQTYRERIDTELCAAQRAQLALQPARADLDRLDQTFGLRIDGAMVTSSELGGDFWTAFRLSEHRLCLLGADFAGHGVAAALNVFRLHSLLGRLPRGVDQPAEILEFLNGELKKLLPLGQYATASCLVFEQGGGGLSFANAGSPMPVIHRAGRAEYVRATGRPLGVLAGSRYQQIEVDFPPGSSLLIYSDGLVEAETGEGLVVGPDELPQWVESLARQPGLADHILERFRAGWPGTPEDDVTVVSLYRPLP